MMKKYLFIFVLIAGIVTANAQNWGGNSGNGNNNNGYTLHAEGDVDYWGKNGSQGNMIGYYREGTGWKFENGAFTFSSKYTWTDLGQQIDPKQSGSLANTKLDLKNITAFGYYKIENGVAGEKMMMFGNRDENGEFTVKNSVIFNDGDKIGIYAKINETKTVNLYEHTVNEGTWVHPNKVTYISESKDSYVNSDGETVQHRNQGKFYQQKTVNVTTTYTTTDDGDNDTVTVINNVDRDSRGDEIQYFCLFLDGFSAVDHYEYYLKHIVTGDDWNDFIDDVNDQNTGGTTVTDSDGNPVTPSTGGQPLPGLLMTLAIGGTAIAGMKKRNKKA